MVWPHPHTQSAEVALLRPHPNKLHAEAARFQDWAPITSLARLDANAPTVSVQRRQIRRCSATDPKSKKGKRSKRSKDNEIHSASTLPPAGPRPQASSARLSQATQISSIYGPARPRQHLVRAPVCLRPRGFQGQLLRPSASRWSPREHPDGNDGSTPPGPPRIQPAPSPHRACGSPLLLAWPKWAQARSLRARQRASHPPGSHGPTAPAGRCPRHVPDHDQRARRRR